MTPPFYVEFVGGPLDGRREAFPEPPAPTIQFPARDWDYVEFVDGRTEPVPSGPPPLRYVAHGHVGPHVHRYVLETLLSS